MTTFTKPTSLHAKVEMSADMAHLSPKEHELLSLLYRVSELIDIVYLKQAEQYTGSEITAFDADKPKGFYPEGMSAENITGFLTENPDKRDEIMSPFTVIVRDGESLAAIPYTEHFSTEMQQISELLNKASDLSDEPTFKEFLRLRALAFSSNQYRESDIAWIHSHQGVFEFTVGPYESYADDLFGVKRTFEAVLGIVLPDETAVAQSFQKYVSDFDAYLGKIYGYSAGTTLTPMVVIDQVYSAGESRYEHLPMAYNLPNDLDIHQEVGSKKVFIRNVMAAKHAHISKMIAQRVLRHELNASFDFENYLRFVIGHESSHGLSFHFDGEHFGTAAAGIEECKADVFGMWFMYYLADQGVISQDDAEICVMQNITDGLRQIRFGVNQAHSIGAVIQIAWFADQGVLHVTEKGFEFDSDLLQQTVISLANKLYAIARSESQEEAASFVSEWKAKVPASVSGIIAGFDDIPVDIDPTFTYKPE